MSSNTSNNKKISDEVKVKIIKELIEPSYVSDIKFMIKSKKYWKITGEIFETMSKIMVAVGSILSFSSGYFSNPNLSFLAGSVSTVSLAMLQFSSFSYSENKKQGTELNIILQKLDLDTIPLLNRNVENFASENTKSTTSSHERSRNYEEKIKKLKSVLNEDELKELNRIER